MRPHINYSIGDKRWIKQFDTIYSFIFYVNLALTAKTFYNKDNLSDALPSLCILILGKILSSYSNDEYSDSKISYTWGTFSGLATAIYHCRALISLTSSGMDFMAFVTGFHSQTRHLLSLHTSHKHRLSTPDLKEILHASLQIRTYSQTINNTKITQQMNCLIRALKSIIIESTSVRLNCTLKRKCHGTLI